MRQWGKNSELKFNMLINTQKLDISILLTMAILSPIFLSGIFGIPLQKQYSYTLGLWNIQQQMEILWWVPDSSMHIHYRALFNRRWKAPMCPRQTFPRKKNHKAPVNKYFASALSWANTNVSILTVGKITRITSVLSQYFPLSIFFL